MIVDYEKIHNTLTIDITTGDSIFPPAKEHSFSKIFDDEHFSLFSYPVETVLAEKLETILSRNITTTRLRDFYDVYVLSGKPINFANLKTALELTCKHRKSEIVLTKISKIISAIKESKNLSAQWKAYTKKLPYAFKTFSSEETGE